MERKRERMWKRERDVLVQDVWVGYRCAVSLRTECWAFEKQWKRILHECSAHYIIFSIIWKCLLIDLYIRSIRKSTTAWRVLNWSRDSATCHLNDVWTDHVSYFNHVILSKIRDLFFDHSSHDLWSRHFAEYRLDSENTQPNQDDTMI